MSATPDRAAKAHEPNRRSVYELEHSRVVLERSPAGPTARIEREDWIEYAGPLTAETIKALDEVSR